MNWRTEEYGGLSNMAGSYPLRVSGIRVFSSEALYQACRFPHQPEWQREIISQQNPMAAKMKSKKEGRRKHHSRSDLEPALRVLGRDRHQKVELQEKAARAFQRTFQYVLRS